MLSSGHLNSEFPNLSKVLETPNGAELRLTYCLLSHFQRDHSHRSPPYSAFEHATRCAVVVMSADRERKASHRLPQQFSIVSQLNSSIVSLMYETENYQYVTWLFFLLMLLCSTFVWLEGVTMADRRRDQTQGKVSVCLLTVPSDFSFARVEVK